MFRQRYGSKYGAKSVVYKGVQYHSKKEAGYASQLDMRLACGDIRSWRRQIKMDLEVNGKHVTNYYLDFEITHNDDSIEYVEVKGFETEVWKLKWRLFEILFGDIPNVKLTVVK